MNFYIWVLGRWRTKQTLPRNGEADPISCPTIITTDLCAEKDPIQNALCGLMEHRVRQQAEVDDRDARAERALRDELLSEAEKKRRKLALNVKRTQVERSRWHTIPERKTIAVMISERRCSCRQFWIFQCQTKREPDHIINYGWMVVMLSLI